MADQNRDRDVGGSPPQGGSAPGKSDRQSDLDRPERMPEQIKGGGTDQPQRPQRKPGVMPLPD